ncbi:MAG: GatB/YqeY domain-containing protein, partial [Pseudomonadota bacterium]
MSLKLQITEDMKAAMRAKDSARLGAIRLLQAAIKQREVDERIELSDADVITAIEKMLKQRRDSIAAYESANRTDLADVEKYEVSVLQGYLPQQLTEAEILSILDQVVADTGAA